MVEINGFLNGNKCFIELFEQVRVLYKCTSPDRLKILIVSTLAVHNKPLSYCSIVASFPGS